MSSWIALAFIAAAAEPAPQAASAPCLSEQARYALKADGDYTATLVPAS